MRPADLLHVPPVDLARGTSLARLSVLLVRRCPCRWADRARAQGVRQPPRLGVVISTSSDDTGDPVRCNHVTATPEAALLVPTDTSWRISVAFGSFSFAQLVQGPSR
eukprot:TRINITY_DN6452_c0_g3_i1.p3 TRINITY_DN6452_c0_g3~~TRINITY_DN6452_c0_g3_i1.p3  ORF type:complete len:107 (+),score=0.54 TRINITY_DN6452_c0_g3_i1:432-752(+)